MSAPDVRARFAAMEKVFLDVSMSTGARVLYWQLDWHSRSQGSCFPKIQRLAAVTGGSIRSVKVWLDELRDAGYIRTERHRCHNSYILAWRDVQPAALLKNGTIPNSALHEVQPAALLTGALPYCINPDNINQNGRASLTRCACGQLHGGAEAVRCQCGRVHYPAESSQVDPVEATRGMLHGYVQRVRLDWPAPDDEICLAVMAAAGGDIGALMEKLRWLLLDRRQAPTKSYAWFVKVAAAGQRRRA